MNPLVYGLLLVILGILAVPSLILAKKPDAKAVFDKIAPFQGLIGVVFAILGIWIVVDSLLNISVLRITPMLWIIWFVGGALMLLLGFILGFGLINKYALAKSAAASAKGDAMLKKLLPLQGTMGFAAIVVGIVEIVIYFMYRT